MLSQSELTSLQKLINDETNSFEDLKTWCISILSKSIYFKVNLTLRSTVEFISRNIFFLYFILFIRKR